MNTTEIHQYGGAISQTRSCGFDAETGIKVLVSPSGPESNERALELAKLLAGDAHELRVLADRLISFNEHFAKQEREIERLRALVPPEKPARLFGRGWVRFESGGRMWLLADREKGWSKFGFVVGGWDDLFRRYDVRVVEHGQDEAGLWWAVENREVQP